MKSGFSTARACYQRTTFARFTFTSAGFYLPGLRSACWSPFGLCLRSPPALYFLSQLGHAHQHLYAMIPGLLCSHPAFLSCYLFAVTLLLLWSHRACVQKWSWISSFSNFLTFCALPWRTIVHFSVGTTFLFFPSEAELFLFGRSVRKGAGLLDLISFMGWINLNIIMIIGFTLMINRFFSRSMGGIMP